MTLPLVAPLPPYTPPRPAPPRPAPPAAIVFLPTSASEDLRASVSKAVRGIGHSVSK